MVDGDPQHLHRDPRDLQLLIQSFMKRA
jgi:hypothetical protein